MSVVSSVLSSRSGEKLAVHDWPHVEQMRPRAAVLLVHSHSEYGMRNGLLAQRLGHMGCVVRTYDQFGHGESTGKGGVMLSMTHFAEDLGDVLTDWRKSLPTDLPVVLLGHGTGALVIGTALMQGYAQVDGVVFSSPILRLALSPWQRLKLVAVRSLAPNFIAETDSDAQYISRDPNAALLFEHDKKRMTKISVRFVDYIFRTGEEMLRLAASWSTPTLVLYAGSDKYTEVLATQEFLAAAPTQVESQNFPALYHEIFNEPERELVYRRLEQWLDKRFPKVAPQRGTRFAGLF